MQNHHISKRRQLAIRFFTYGVMTVATVVVSFVCILLVLGYRFNIQSHTVEQGGLIQFRSFPSDADIVLDGKSLDFNTPGKSNVDVGKHSVTMRRSGYQEWSATTSIKAGQLRWLNYARLVPATITTQPVRSFVDMAGMLPSPDKRWIALLPSASAPQLVLADIRNPQKPAISELSLPAGSFTVADGQTSAFRLVEWDFGAKYLLVEHKVGDSVEFIRVDRTNANNTTNVTGKMKADFRQVHFSGNSGNVFYALTGSDIRKVDIGGDGSMSAALVSEVENFELYKTDYISYAAFRGSRRQVGVYRDGKNVVLRTYDADESVKADMSSYFDEVYVAIAHGTSVEVLEEPFDTTNTSGRTIFSGQFDRPVAWVQFGNSGRFATAGSGAEFVTYDIETDETFRASLSSDDTPADRPLRWLDDFYLATDAGGHLVMGEFDGDNQHRIAGVKPGYGMTLSDDGKYMFSIGESAGSVVLQSSKMVVD